MKVCKVLKLRVGRRKMEVGSRKWEVYFCKVDVGRMYQNNGNGLSRLVNLGDETK